MYPVHLNSSAALGLGALLRYVAEQVDQGAEEHTRRWVSTTGRVTRRSCAPWARGPPTVTAHGRQTQGAINQTVKLMGQAGLVERYGLPDGRKSGLRLTAAGSDLLKVLEPHWESTFRAIAALEEEIGHPLRSVLQDAARALDRQGFAARVAAATEHVNVERGNKAAHA